MYRPSNLFTCTKVFRDIPFAHRQPKHDGHCAFIHGHNWTIHVTFGAFQKDECGFVYDFGKLECLKDILGGYFDHALVYNQDDTKMQEVINTFPEMFKATPVPDCSCEGLAEHLRGLFDVRIREVSEGRAFVYSVQLDEDADNTASSYINPAVLEARAKDGTAPAKRIELPVKPRLETTEG